MKIPYALIGLCTSLFFSGCSDNQTGNNPIGAGSDSPPPVNQTGGSETVGSEDGDAWNASCFVENYRESCPFSPESQNVCCWCDCMDECSPIFQGEDGEALMYCLYNCNGSYECSEACWNQYPEVMNRYFKWRDCLTANCQDQCASAQCDWIWGDSPCDFCWHNRCDCVPVESWFEFSDCVYTCESVHSNQTTYRACQEACFDRHVDAAALYHCIIYLCSDECSGSFGF